MNAEEIMAGILALEQQDFERLLALIKEHDAKLQARRAGNLSGSLNASEHLAARTSSKGDGALARLADMERREREAQSNLE